MTAPFTLAYDDLPPGSDIRREYGGPDGRSVRIIVPAGEPPRPVVRAAAQSAVVFGAMSSAALLLLFFAIFVYFVQINDIRGVALRWAIAFFAVFCTAIVALVAWVRYGVLLEALQQGRRQATVMAITPAGIIVETSGPFGVTGIDVPAERVRDALVETIDLRDLRDVNRRVNALVIHLTDGRRISLMPARDAAELQWVAGTVRPILNVPRNFV